MYMIGVMVCVQHTVDLSDIVLKALLPEVCRCVDQEIETIVLDQNRGSQALVVWVVRFADITGAA